MNWILEVFIQWALRTPEEGVIISVSNKSLQKWQKNCLWGKPEIVLFQPNMWIWGSAFRWGQMDKPRSSSSLWKTVGSLCLCKSHSDLWPDRQSSQKCIGVNPRSFEQNTLNHSLRVNLRNLTTLRWIVFSLTNTRCHYIFMLILRQETLSKQLRSKVL